MKKIFLFTLLLLPLLFSSTIQAQELTYEKAYQDYLFKLDVYRKEEGDFKRTRDSYSQNKTLGLKEQLRVELQEMLIARNELVSTYLLALRMKLITMPDHPGSLKGDIISDIPSESEWYLTQKGEYDKVNDSLETLITKSQKADDHYFEFSDKLIHQAISTISFSKYLDLKIQHENVYKEAKEEIAKLSGDKRILFDRWITDIDAEFQKVTNLELKAQAIREELKNNKKKNDPEKIYNNFINTLSDAQDSFIAINGFLEEMVSALNIN